MTTVTYEYYNTTTSENMDDQTGFSQPLLTFAAVVTFIIMIVGIFGNLLTVIALLKCPKVRNVAAAFIISLCLADLLFCSLVLPFSAIRFIEGTWTHGDVLCKLIPFIQYGNIGVSLLCIGMITINRYVMIAHHSSYAKIYKKHWIAIMIAFCWLFSYGMQLPTLLGAWGVFDYDPKLGTCSIMNDAHGKSSKTALFLTAFVIPCIIIIACYTKIFWVVHKSEQRLKNHANAQNSIPNNQRQQLSTPNLTNDPNTRISSNVGSESSFSTATDTKQESLQKQTRIKDQRDLRAKRNEWRITKMVLAIFLSFVICYLPITLAKVADKNVEHPGFQIFSYIMLYLSACINPIIYVIMNKQYRKAYKTVLTCCPTGLLPFGKNGVNGAVGAGGSSLGEKWKDIGFSNNHSKTIVSQMSSVDPPSTSYASSQPAAVTVEMTTKPCSTAESTLSHIKSTTTTPKTENTNPFQLKESANQVTPLSLDQHTVKTTLSPLQITIKPQRNQPEISRIALAGGDIILEEEEEQPAIENNTTNAEIMNPAVSEKANELNEINIVEIGKQKKIQSYGQNINAIPDSNLKLTSKEKIQKD